MSGACPSSMNVGACRGPFGIDANPSIGKGIVMSFEIKVRVVALETGRPLSNLDVQAMDADILHDDPLGAGRSNDDGIVRIPVETGVFQIDDPDVYVLVRSKDGRVLAST